MRVMFIWDGEPLGEAPVHLETENGREEIATDEDGQIITASRDQNARARVLVNTEQDRWVSAALDLGGSKPLLVVDLNVAARSGTDSGLTMDNVLAGPNQSLGDRYVFTEILGRGGMGVVVRARDALLNRDVAIKMLNEEFSTNQDAQSIFLTEARSIATLQHPNLVGIYDVTMIEGRAMIVFEYVQGKNLDRVLGDSGRLSEAAILRVGIQMSRALRYLHEMGIIHRDIKPANVIIQDDGVIRIIDFGLARSLEEIQIKGTQVRGTPAYMAPEQIEGGELLEATDVYQLGVTLYELTAGRLPFETGNVGYSHLFKEPPPIEEIVPGISESIRLLIHACLAKEPAARPTTNELFFALQEAYLAGSSEYDQDQRIVQSNEPLLFAATSEIQLEKMRSSEFSTTSPDRDPGLANLTNNRTNPALPPAITAPAAEQGIDDGAEEDSSPMLKIVTIGGLLGACIAALGIAMVMNMPDESTKSSAPRADAIAASSSPEAAPAKAPPAKAPPSEPAGALDTNNLALETTPAIAQTAPTEAPETTPAVEKDAPALAEKAPPEKEEEVAQKKAKAPRDVKAKSVTAPDPEEKSPEVATATSKKPPAAEKDPVEPEAVADTKVKPVDEKPPEVDEKVAAADKKEDESKEDEDEKKTRTVIRKKVIRKKVIRKKTTKPAAAPTSF